MRPSPHTLYARSLRDDLPAEVFRPVPARLLWLAVHVAAAAAGIAVIASGVGGLPVAALVSLPVGLAFAGMAFVAHETLHGATVRRTWLRNLLGGIGFAPFVISPRHWSAWHNRVHHNHTMDPRVDPDAWPTLEKYQQSRRTRVADMVSFGGRRLVGVVTLLLGLCGQSVGVLLSAGPRADYLGRRAYALALVETGAALGFWVGLSILFGPRMLIFGWLVPVALANVLLMAHILTNHGLSALTETNDPLENSLSVTVPRWLDRLTLQFGLHVEHHLFPSVSGRHAPRIRELLRARWPGRYRELPLFVALGRLFRTGRVYKNGTTLFDPRSGAESPTL